MSLKSGRLSDVENRAELARKCGKNCGKGAKPGAKEI